MELKLKELRKLAGYKSARELAERLHVAPSTVASWEIGLRDMPLSRAVELCNVLGCSLEELAGRAPVDRLKNACDDLSELDREKLADFAEFLKKRK